MNKNLFHEPDTPIVLVVFSDGTAIRWMRILRRGFRHCFVLMRQPDGAWVMIDSLPNRVSVRSFDTQAVARLLPYLIRRGDRILPVTPVRRPRARTRRMRPFSCVELTIRLLGMRTLNVLTPYHLFRTIKKLQRI